MGDPAKYHEDNILIHDPSGLIHFINETKREYYWTANTSAPYINEKDDNLKGYFGFRHNSNELVYFDESGHYKRINCNKLKQELESINKGRKDGVRFKFSTIDTTFWLDFYKGTVCLHKNEVENKHLDMFKIVRRDYHIWDDAEKKMDLRFSRFIEYCGPCICKPYDTSHCEDDYTQKNIQDHENLRDSNMFVLHFREYVDLLRYEFRFKRLPKERLVVFDNLPVDDHHKTYNALFEGRLSVIAKEITGANQATKDRLSQHLYKFNNNKQFLTFYGICEFKNRSFLVFDRFSHCAINSTRKSLFDSSQEEEEEEKERLLKNLKGLIEGVSYMHNDVRVYGNVGTTSVVLVENDVTRQHELKLFVDGFFVDDESDDFGDYQSKTKKDDLIGLGEVFERLIDMFDCENEESKHLIECLRNGSCNISDLKEHATFWAPEKKLDFIEACYKAWRNIHIFEQSLPSIDPVLNSGKRGNIHKLLFRRMERYGSYAIGRPSGAGQLIRFIRHAKTHEKEVSRENEGRFYKRNLKGMEEYFRVRFPNLVIELYKLVQQTCAKNEIFILFDIPPRYHSFDRHGNNARSWFKHAR